MVDISSYLGKQIVTHAEFANSESSFNDLSNAYDLTVSYNRDKHKDIIKDFFTQNDINVNDEQFSYVLDAIDDEMSNMPNASIEDILHLLTQIHGEEINTTPVLQDQEYGSIFNELDSDKDGHLELNTFISAIEGLLGEELDDDLSEFINDYYFTVVSTNGLFTKEDMAEFLEMLDEGDNQQEFDSDRLNIENINNPSSLDADDAQASQGLFNDITHLFQQTDTSEGKKSFETDYDKNLMHFNKLFQSDVSKDGSEEKRDKIENFITDINSYFEAQSEIPESHAQFAGDMIQNMLKVANIGAEEQQELINLVTNSDLKNQLISE